MFFKQTYSRNSKAPVLQLVENIRTAKGPRQRVVVSLGTYFKIAKSIRSDVARIVKERLLGQLPLFVQEPNLIAYADKIVKKIQTEGKWNSARERVCKFIEETQNNRTAEVFIDEVCHGYSRQLGTVLIGHHFWQRLNFANILKGCGFNERQIKTAEISVLNRLIAQDSEYSIISWLQTVALDELLGIDTSSVGDDRFYRISDKLLKNQAAIEERLYQRQKDLFSLEDSVFLYDLTNTYFEGVCAGNPKAQYSKNQKAFTLQMRNIGIEGELMGLADVYALDFGSVSSGARWARDEGHRHDGSVVRNATSTGPSPNNLLHLDDGGVAYPFEYNFPL